MKILVTGGAGFLGSHLCDRLIERGDEVICVDNLYTGTKKNIQHHLNNTKFNFVEHDVELPYQFEVDQIYNLACPASPVHYQKNPIKTLKTSVIGAINCLSLANKLGIRVLQASTSEIYGDPEVHPQSETYKGNVNPIGPRACYDEGKRCAETLFYDYHRTENVDIRVIRIFNTYGPRMLPDDGRVVSNFICQAIKNKNITVYGNGNQTRSFCYVDDLINGMIKTMEQEDHVGPINLGNDVEFKIINLANKILNHTDTKSQIIYSDLPKDDPLQRKPDLLKARTLLDWSPTIQLKEGLTQTIQYFKSIVDND